MAECRGSGGGEGERSLRQAGVGCEILGEEETNVSPEVCAFGRTREIWKHESFGTRPKHVLKFNETENSISKPSLAVYNVQNIF